MSLHQAHEDVKHFMKVAGQEVPEDLSTVFEETPTDTQDELDQIKLYAGLIAEEFNELLDSPTLKDAADACADLIWVTIGLMVSLGVPSDKVWQAVKDSNYSKLVDGKIVRREDGKIMKPDTYFPPNLDFLTPTTE